MGHIFKLGTRYSEPLRAVFVDEDGSERPLIMGSYGIGPGRVLATAVEQGHDEHGIVWPLAIAPYDVHVVALPGAASGGYTRGSRSGMASLTASNCDQNLANRSDIAGPPSTDSPKG